MGMKTQRSDEQIVSTSFWRKMPQKQRQMLNMTECIVLENGNSV